MTVEIAVLGPLRVRVDGREVTAKLSASQRALLGVLAAASEPVAKAELRRSVGLAPASLDPQLSKLRSSLGVSDPLYRTRHPGPGYLSLDRDAVIVDADLFRDHVELGTRAFESRRYEEALEEFEAADGLWRGTPFEDVTLTSDAAGESPVSELIASLRVTQRRFRELAARGWLHDENRFPAPERLVRWAVESIDSDVCWLAATRAVLDAEGGSAARGVLASWRSAGIGGAISATHPFAVAERLIAAAETGASEPVTIAEESRGDVVTVLRALAARAAARFDYDAVVELCAAALEHTSPAARSELLLDRAEAYRLLGQWPGAEADLLAAADAAREVGDLVREAEATLAVAWVTWDPDRFGGSLDERLEALLAELPRDQEELRLRVEACLSGGLYQDGSVRVDRAERYARHALERLDHISDPRVAAQTLSQARKGLIDIDPPELQLARARRILVLGRGSAHHRCLGHLAAVVDLLQLGCVEDARAETEHHRAAARRTKSRLHAYQQAGVDAMWALADGRFPEAESETDLAERLSTSFDNITVAQVVLGQRVWHAYETGDAARLRPILETIDRFAAADAALPVWSCAATFFHAELGNRDEAHGRLQRIAHDTSMFRDLPRGPLRIAVLSFAAASAGRLATERNGLERLGAVLLEELEAHQSRAVLVGWPVLFLGSKHRFEGLAALAAGEPEIAVDRLRAAAVENQGTAPNATRTLADLELAESRL